MNLPKLHRTLLIIDDDKNFGEVIRDHLTSGTMEVFTVHSGAAARSIFENHKVDVVLLDQKLPDMEGHDLCPFILGRNDQAKIIFITAHPSFEGAVKAIRLGAYDYLSKPFALEELNLAVEKAFRTINLEKVEQLQNYKRERESEQTAFIGEMEALPKP